MKFETFNKMLFPEGIKCIVCDSELPISNRYCVCDKCTLIHNVVSCSICGRAIKDENYLEQIIDFSKKEKNNFLPIEPNDDKIRFVCLECKRYPVYFKEANAPFQYDDKIKLLVHKLKYSNALYLTKYMARFMADRFLSLNWKIDFITFAPMTDRRKKRRGYNQAEQLAKYLSEILNIECVSVLDKIADIKNLTKLKRAQRLKAISDSIRVIEGLNFNNQTILFVDDVFTSGATSNECSKQLVERGAKEVYVLTFATSQGLIKE